MAIFYPHKTTRKETTGAEPISLAEAKLYLRVDHDSEDELILNFIKAARENAEDHMKMSLVQQIFNVRYQKFSGNAVHLNMSPVKQVISIKITNPYGTTYYLNDEDYTLNDHSNIISINTDIYNAELEVIYETDDIGESLDENIRQAIIAHLSALYDYRGESKTPGASIDTYNKYRRFVL